MGLTSRGPPGPWRVHAWSCSFRQAASGLLLLLPIATEGWSAEPGRYHLLHRLSGRYLLQEGSLGELSGVEGSAALWSLSAGEEPGLYRLTQGSQPLGAAKGLSSRPASQEEEEGAIQVSSSSEGYSWRLFSSCRGSCVTIVDPRGRVLAAVASKGESSEPNALTARLLPAEKAVDEAQWVLLPPCLGEDASEAQSSSECFPAGSTWASMAADCCDPIYGPSGNSDCWDGQYSFERCCLQKASSGKSPGLSAARAAAAAPRLLCSGERLLGETRFVRLAGFDGERLWQSSESLASQTKFDFAPQVLEVDGVRRVVSIADNLPACGGPSLLEEAGALLEDVEQHYVQILRSLHEAMLRLAASEAPQSSKGSFAEHHAPIYLPFFPYLLMALHRRTGSAEFVRCLSQTAATLAQLPAWQRNAGYDFVLPLGYDRPWERRNADTGSARDSSLSLTEPDPYSLETYDPRFANVLLLATHDVFFGDRQSIFLPNYGGAAYRNLRNIVVPLPFTLNCLSWRQALADRAGPAARTRQFRVSFVGSVNGVSRDIVRRAAVRLSDRLPEAQRARLAVRFVVSDEERAALANDPATALGRWFGGSVGSFDELLRQSEYCLVLPGDVSDLAMRFFHALSVGCVPVVVGGPSVTIPPPFAEFVDYRSFAKFARVADVSEAEELLHELLLEDPPAVPSSPAEIEQLLGKISGLFVQQEDCDEPGPGIGKPFLGLLARSLEARSMIWRHLRWFN